MGLTTLKNNTGVPQSIVFKGRQIVIDGNAEQTFDEQVATMFLEMRQPLVIKAEDPVDAFSDDPENMVWIANMTGNIDLPEKVQVKRLINKSWEYVDAPNPKRKKTEIKREWDMGMQSYTAKDGALEMLNLGKKWITVPAFSRRLFPKNVASWSLNRDSRLEPESRGSITKSRAPTEFEPTSHWKLDDIRAYFRLIDPGAEVGPSEAEVRKAAKTDENAVRAGESGEAAYVDAAKRLIINRLFFRVVDPQYTLPTQAEFHEFITGVSGTAPDSEAAVLGLLASSTKAVQKRKRGRPRKKPEIAVVAEAKQPSAEQPSA